MKLHAIKVKKALELEITHFHIVYKQYFNYLDTQSFYQNLNIIIFRALKSFL